MTLAGLGEMLNVAIVLIFLYLAVSLAASALLEAIVGWMQVRAKQLKDRIGQLFDDPHLGHFAKEIYESPLIRAISNPGGKQGERLPSYIGSGELASAVLDVLRRTATAPPAIQVLLDELGEGASTEEKKERIAAWYDEAMARLSGRFKRRSQGRLFLLGLAIAAAFNLDSLAIGSALWADRTRLEPLVAGIETWQAKLVKDNPASIGVDGRLVPSDEQWAAIARSPEMRELVARAATAGSVELPMGWDVDRLKETFWGPLPRIWETAGLLAVLGWAITGLAAMLGAQYWFDILGGALALRAAGVRPPNASEPGKR